MSDTTNINDLPIASQTSSHQNVVLQTNELHHTNINSSSNSIVAANSIQEKNTKIENNMRKLQEERKQLDQVQSQHATDAPKVLAQKTLNQLVSGIQQASASGMTSLPSRDIPRNTNRLTSDEQVQPNYIPEPSKDSAKDYISEDEKKEDIIRQQRMKQNKEDTLDVLYNELQTPVLISVLFFLFQLPFFRKKLFKHIPSLFSDDGHPNIYGFTFTSITFGAIYYMLQKTLKHFSTW